MTSTSNNAVNRAASSAQGTRNARSAADRPQTIIQKPRKSLSRKGPMDSMTMRISKEVLWIFVLNLAICILSLVAGGIANKVPGATWFEQLSFNSTFGIQLGLLVLSTLTAFILTAIFDSKNALFEEIKDSMRTTEEFREDLAKGIVRYEGQAYRSLRYLPEQGSIYYGDVTASNRNILFNNETIKMMFQTVQSAKCGVEPVKIGDRLLLYEVGYRASQRFAKHFQDHVESKGIRFDLATWLLEWVEYDRNAGFGNMAVRELAADHHEASVVITHSFLTHGGHLSAAESLCDFMVGYMEGLLKNFADALYSRSNLDRSGIRVVHDKKEDCFLGHQDPEKGCTFHVQVPRKP